MKLEQIEQIVFEVRGVYPQLKKEMTLEQMLDLYANYLINKDFDLVWNNLKNHIENSRFVPTIADLVKKQDFYRTPTREETIKDIERLEKWQKEACSPEEAKKHIEQIKANFLGRG